MNFTFLEHSSASAHERQSCSGLGGARERVVLEGFAGLCGRYQRVRIDPAELDGLPAAVDVTLEVRGAGEDLELWGRPRGGCPA